MGHFLALSKERSDYYCDKNRDQVDKFSSVLNFHPQKKHQIDMGPKLNSKCEETMSFLVGLVELRHCGALCCKLAKISQNSKYFSGKSLANLSDRIQKDWNLERKNTGKVGTTTFYLSKSMFREKENVWKISVS